MSVWERTTRRLRPKQAMFLALFVSTAVTAGCAGEPAVPVTPAADGKTCTLTLDYGDDRPGRDISVAWRAEMTAMDVLRQAMASESEFTFAGRGSGATAFVTTIDGIVNEGGKEGARNWIFKMNGTKSPESAGVAKISEGDVVLWKFSTAVE